jgi:hydroxyacylglutathione hydrolase
MQIKQWEDKNLAQFSYAILSDCGKKMVLIDPSRDPQPYLEFAKHHDAAITGIIETHPHADFVSSHKELSQITGAPIYVSSLVGAHYAHSAFDDGQAIEFGKIRLTALNTPGHSPDSISVLLEYDGKQNAVFSGDTLLIGDCGRPDLREGAGNLKVARLELAKSMYHTLRNKFLPLNDDVLLYPAHGAGTLCGKGLSKANRSTMGQEKLTNWSLQNMSEEDFVSSLLSDQPFIPAYFPFDVEVNRRGAQSFKESVDAVIRGHAVAHQGDEERLEKQIIVIDARNDKQYKKGHLPNSVNLMEGAKFETWLGSIVQPGEIFYLAGESNGQLTRLIARAAAIGYEAQIKEAFVISHGPVSDPLIDTDGFKSDPEAYTIVDVRNRSEVNEKKIFNHSLSIPLPELRNRFGEIPTDKPIVVHCAAGYRSAAGSSIIQSAVKGEAQVLDLSDHIEQFKQKRAVEHS